MRTDHRRPLAAYGLVALVCALVMWQPTIGANVASRAPVVTALMDIGLSPGELLSRVVGGDLFSVSPVAAPDEQLPASEPVLVDDLMTPAGPGVPGVGGGGTAPAVSLDAGLTDADGGADDGAPPGGNPTPGGGPGQPDDDGKPGTDAPQGDKGAVPQHPGKGPKDKGEDHPGKGPKGKGEDHPGKGPKDKGEDHPGKGPKDKGEDHPGKGPKDKGEDHPGKGPKDKPKDKGAKRGSSGRGPNG